MPTGEAVGRVLPQQDRVIAADVEDQIGGVPQLQDPTAGSGIGTGEIIARVVDLYADRFIPGVVLG